jgi:hypothetical protein
MQGFSYIGSLVAWIHAKIVNVCLLQMEEFFYYHSKKLQGKAGLG